MRALGCHRNSAGAEGSFSKSFGPIGEHLLVLLHSADMPSLQHQIEELARSSNRYNLADIRRQIDRLLSELRQTNPSRAAQLQAEHFFALGFMDYPTAVEQLQFAAGIEGASEEDRMFALSALARITRGRVSDDENEAYRRDALALARATGNTLRELVILVNWGIVAAEDGRPEVADRMFFQAEEVLPRLSDEDRGHRVVAEVVSRRAAIAGKRALRALKSQDDETLRRRYSSALELFIKALDAAPNDAHRQVNTRIELAAELVDLGDAWVRLTAPSIGDALDGAHRGLNAHACENCEAYYNEVQGRFHTMIGRVSLASGNDRAREFLTRGLSELSLAEKQLRTRRHPKADELLARIAEVQHMIDSDARPRKIFLSHSGRDKELVRQVKNLLETLRFEPWLDEDAMVAGTPLERGLLAGMQESCAAVFFITENFVDSNYLATEIDYAIQEKRAKHDQFSIVTLVLSDTVTPDGIPALLRRYVFKQSPSLLTAMNELVRALPLIPARPFWRDTPPLLDIIR